jgi:hypothetical protein
MAACPSPLAIPSTIDQRMGRRQNVTKHADNAPTTHHDADDVPLCTMHHRQCDTVPTTQCRRHDKDVAKQQRRQWERWRVKGRPGSGRSNRYAQFPLFPSQLSENRLRPLPSILVRAMRLNASREMLSCVFAGKEYKRRAYRI